jgi:hypothetical protein
LRTAAAHAANALSRPLIEGQTGRSGRRVLPVRPALLLTARRQAKPTRRITRATVDLVRSSHLGLTWANGVRPECYPQVKRAPPTLCGGFGSGSAGRLAWLAFPAGVGVEGGGAEGLEPGEQVVQPPVVVDPGLVVAVLLRAEPAADGFRGDLAGPLPVGAVQAGRGGSAWQPQLGRPQRVRRWVIEPGSTMPVRAMAASSAAMFSASAWWLAATRTASGWHRSFGLVMSYCISTV